MIDAHTHRYPDEVIQDPVSFAEKRQEFHWLDLVRPAGKTSLQGWANREKMLNDMDEAKIDRCVLLGWYWENQETCQWQNDYYATCLDQDPNRFIGFASFHSGLANPVEELERRRDQGFLGIGECHPWVQGSSPRDPIWMNCMEFASNAGWPVTFHVTEPVGHEYPGRVPTPFEDFLWIARQFPDLKIILAHAGGLFPFYELNPQIKSELTNVFYDLAACPLLYESGIYRQLIQVVGCEKLLWGTDYPLRIFPKTQKEPNFSSFQEIICREGKLNDEEKAAIFGKNLLSLLPC